MKSFPNFGVCYDYAHAAIFGDSLRIWTETVAPYVKHLRINDNDLKNDLRLAVGSGKINRLEFRKLYFEYFGKYTVLLETAGTKNQRDSAEFLRKIGVIA